MNKPVDHRSRGKQVHGAGRHFSGSGASSGRHPDSSGHRKRTRHPHPQRDEQKERSGYSVFSHTADVGLHLYGRSLENLFENAAMGMLSLLTDHRKFGAEKTVTLHIRSTSWEFLLVNWLQEILYFFTAKKTGFSKFIIKEISPHYLIAQGFGSQIDLKKHPIYREIKAVTYHNLKIIKERDGFKADVIFDI